jgi:hypothetical protein
LNFFYWTSVSLSKFGSQIGFASITTKCLITKSATINITSTMLLEIYSIAVLLQAGLIIKFFKPHSSLIGFFATYQFCFDLELFWLKSSSLRTIS